MIVSKANALNMELGGRVVAFPTDTVYGVGAKMDDYAAIERIYALKKRTRDKPLAILCATLDQVRAIAHNYDDFASIANQHWPGALTLVVKKRPHVSDVITADKDTVGIRVPDDAFVREFLHVHGPMAVTSLNESGEPAVTRFTDAQYYLGEVDVLVKGGNLTGSASTVYDTLTKRVIREGPVQVM